MIVALLAGIHSSSSSLFEANVDGFVMIVGFLFTGTRSS